MDKTVTYILEGELQRQQQELELIASENYVSPAVLAASANIFTNKYSEGYPGKRYYGGQEWVDKLELLCQLRALQIFDLQDRTLNVEPTKEQLEESLDASEWHVNVQPLSGSPANLAVYLGILQPGDTILAMDLAAGGHLSHGHRLNASGIYYSIATYGVDTENHQIDYDQLLTRALETKPQLIIAGFSAYPRSIDWSRFSAVADQVQEKHGYRPILMADIAHIAGLIAGGVLTSPFPYMDIVTTTTHKTLRGPRGALIYAHKGDLLRNSQVHNLPKEIDRGVFPGMQGGPHMHTIAAKAVAFGEILDQSLLNMQGQPETFVEYAERVVANAQLLAQTLSEAGWHIVTGGTDNHIVMVDVTHFQGTETMLTGSIAEQLLEQIGISTNKNMIPFDPRSPRDPSGLRLGTPAITTRGLGTDAIKTLGGIIDQALHADGDQSVLNELKDQVAALCQDFPLPYTLV